MGAQTFYTTAEGKTAREAFDKARADALHEYGHRGYTGTIAEKHVFAVIKMPVVPKPDADPKLIMQLAQGYAEGLIDEADYRVDDKGGPAGCIEFLPGKFLFFGWASS